MNLFSDQVVSLSPAAASVSLETQLTSTTEIYLKLQLAVH